MQTAYRRAAPITLMLAAVAIAACSDQPLAVPATRAFDAARADAPSPSPNADSPPLIGDCNGDWKIDARDAQQMEGMNGPIDPRDQMRAYQACDIDATLRVDAKDAEIVWTYLKEGKSDFPLGWPATCPDLAVVSTEHVNMSTEMLFGFVRYDAYVVNLGTMTFRWSDSTQFIPSIVLADGSRVRFYFLDHQGGGWSGGYTDTGMMIGSAPFGVTRKPHKFWKSLPRPPREQYDIYDTNSPEAIADIRLILSPWSVELAVNPANYRDGNPSNDDCQLSNNSFPGQTPARAPAGWWWGAYYPE